MTEPSGAVLVPLLLSSASALVQQIHDRVVAEGFTDLRPAHGFVFTRLAPDGATVTEVAEHLGVTKQAASQQLDELVRKGYVGRAPHPDDARARLMTLTDRGWAATRAADRAGAAVVATWSETLGRHRVTELIAALSLVAPGGRLRPIW